ncbi:hypothetical protein QYF61_026824 [Mycteria americana]|uniref:RNase H type-1 domain-containing protein n=1 Tax=Mycteria americana TaxID=33587 RepID=A0AAN7N038_MYCAM|nr:hypothetical protein QYF61_026824 [Mycteria americana]
MQTTVEYLRFEVSQGKRPVNTSAQKSEIVTLTRALELSENMRAILKPKEVSVMQCKAHQTGQTDIISGNQKADETAKRAALTHSKVGALIPTGRVLLEPPTYLEKDNQLANLLNCTKTKDGWWTTDTGQIIVTAPLMTELIKKTHQETHMGADAVIADIR